MTPVSMTPWRTAVTIALGAVAVTGLVAVTASAAIDGHWRDHSPASATALPPWPAPQPPGEYVAAAGLEFGPAEGFLVHFHAHLDIFVNGQPEPVASHVGIEHDSGLVTALHTHELDGILHVESFAPDPHLTLGQFFTEWGVLLTSDSVGGLRASADSPLTAYVNGERWTGDPAEIELTPRAEIALVYGSPPPEIPAAFAFPPNY